MMPKRSNTRRPRKNGKPSRQGNSFRSGLLSDSATYAGQQTVRLSLTGGSTLVSTTVTTGVIAFAAALQVGSIGNFATRFGNTFDEYRILGVTVRVRPVSAATGVSAFFFDEKVTGAPILDDAAQRTVMLFPNSNASSRTMQTMNWRARDLLDLQYTPVGTTSVVPATFKIYSDSANYGAPIAATAVWLYEPVYHVEFRGIKSQ